MTHGVVFSWTSSTVAASDKAPSNKNLTIFYKDLWVYPYFESDKAQRTRCLACGQSGKKSPSRFEMSARKFMLETLRQAKNLRAQPAVGFYLFPGCYNHIYSHLENYSGSCPGVEVARNSG
ncbi:hyaluronidase-2 [Lates japonicus]|uniref:Hyaluronidase n=1 Tax=Lates japonicus TaxID=270547 RepID=A0AAD3RD26_LATJO|nr:hyaluronidase-2 [Lates japonicus]